MARINRGFTLIELVLVAVVVAILAILAISRYLNFKQDAEDNPFFKNVLDPPATEGGWTKTELGTGTGDSCDRYKGPTGTEYFYGVAYGWLKKEHVDG